MGQAVSELIKAIDGDKQEEKRRQAEDALNALKLLAEAKAHEHYSHVISDAEDAKLLPVSQVTNKVTEMYCGFSQHTDQLESSIKDSLSSFVKGDIVSVLDHGYVI